MNTDISFVGLNNQSLLDRFLNKPLVDLNDNTIIFNSSNKIAFISSELMFNEQMLEYLRGMDLIIIDNKATCYHFNDFTIMVRALIKNETYNLIDEHEFDIEGNSIYRDYKYELKNIIVHPDDNSLIIKYDETNYRPCVVQMKDSYVKDYKYYNYLYKILKYNENCFNHKSFIYSFKPKFTKCHTKICKNCYKSDTKFVKRFCSKCVSKELIITPHMYTQYFAYKFYKSNYKIQPENEFYLYMNFCTELIPYLEKLITNLNIANLTIDQFVICDQKYIKYSYILHGSVEKKYYLEFLTNPH